MKNWILFSLFLASTSIMGQVTLTTSNLPIVVITTPPGQVIEDNIRIVCDMGIIDHMNGTANNITDPFDNYNGKIAIEIRGSTSQQYPKKSYGFETQTATGLNNNVSLMGLPVENDWILYGPYPDKTLLRDVLTYDLSQKMGHYASHWKHCEVIINNEYQGVYILLERIKRDNDRVDIARLDADDLAGDSLTGGYIIKVDKLTGEVGFSWPSNFNSEVVFQFHDPEYDELDPIQVAYLQNYVSNFENAVNGPDINDPSLGYNAFIEPTSFYDFFLLQELGRTVDGYRSSSFMHKDRNDGAWNGRLIAGPMWDFNLSYGNADYCDANLTTGWQYNFDLVCDFSSAIPFWWKRLLDSPTYRNGLKCRWETLRNGPLHTDSIHQFIDSMALYLQDARIRNFQQWPIIGVYVNWNAFVGATYEEDLNFLKSYIADRAEWIDANLVGTCDLAVSNLPQPEPKYITVFPNPVDDQLNIGYTMEQPGIVQFQLLDATGRSVYEWNKENTKKGAYFESISVNDLAPGSYWVSLNGSSHLTERFIKK